MNKYVDFYENSKSIENGRRDYLVVLIEMICAFLSRSKIKTVICAALFLTVFVGTVGIVGGIEAGAISLGAGFPLIFILSLIAWRSTCTDED